MKVRIDSPPPANDGEDIAHISTLPGPPDPDSTDKIEVPPPPALPSISPEKVAAEHEEIRSHFRQAISELEKKEE